MAELANCERCGNVFVKGMRDVCNHCYKEEEKAFETVYRFLAKRENREATLPEIVKATRVEEEFIIKLLKENRLRASEFPKLTYPCETCGIQIVTGRLCDRCTKEILVELTQHQESEGKKADGPNPVYYSFRKRER